MRRGVEKMQFNFITASPELREIHSDIKEILCGRPIYFRRTFSVAEAGEATLHITALGIYEIYLDGEKLGQEFLSPGWTDYNSRLYYDTFSLTLSPGKHCLAAVVADGWYSGNVGGVGPRHYDEIVALGARLLLADGTEMGTDTSWHVGVGGYLYADIIHGECYDAGAEPAGWKTLSFDDSGWENAANTYNYVTGTKLLTRFHPGVRHMHTLRAVAETRDSHGNYIYDLGQNMSGVIRIRLKARKGDRVTLRYGEMLDGTDLYTANLRTARQTDVFIAGTDGEEEYMPRFTFHGFRYVESSMPLLSVEGIVLYSDCAQTGFIETSSALVNQIFSNQLWGQRCNFLDVPTDCPQRDERMGWTGDTQIFARTGMYNMDTCVFYQKYMQDMQDAIFADGSVPNVVPRVFKSRGQLITGTGTAAWGDAIFIIPYHLWKMYGDAETMKECYGDMLRYFAYLEARAEGHLQPDMGYGDWLNSDAVTAKALVATAYFAYDAQLLAEIAEELGKKEDTLYFRTAYAAIRNAFLKEYEEEDGRLLGDTQCAYVLALRFGLYSNKEKTAKHLARAIRERENHLSTSFVGTAYLLPVLSDAGMDELAYTLLLQETYPSWGYCISLGATTMWERWNSYSDTDGFGDVGMNSFNHYSFGAVAEWMYAYMGGIRPLAPAFTRFAVEPHMDKRVPRVSVRYKSASGEIAASYDTEKGICTVTVPEGTTARVSLRGSIAELAGGTHTLTFAPIQ